MSTLLSPNKYPSNAATNTYVYDFTVGTAYSTNTSPSSAISSTNDRVVRYLVRMVVL